MKKTLSCLVLTLALSLVLTPVNQALNTTFTVSASVPAATTVSISAFRVNSATNAFTPVSGTSLSLDPMTYSPSLGIYLPDHFFAIDVASSGGSGSPSVTVTYTEGTNPNSPAHGLGWKSVATFVKVIGSTETGISAHGPKKLLKDLSGEQITSAETSGGFLRMYLGIVTKDNSATFPDPVTGEPFTNADKSGGYNGTFLVSATAT